MDDKISTTEAVALIQDMQEDEQGMACVIKADGNVRLMRFEKTTDPSVDRLIEDQRTKNITVFDKDMSKPRRLDLDGLQAIAIGIGFEMKTFNVNMDT